MKGANVTWAAVRLEAVEFTFRLSATIVVPWIPSVPMSMRASDLATATLNQADRPSRLCNILPPRDLKKSPTKFASVILVSLKNKIFLLSAVASISMSPPRMVASLIVISTSSKSRSTKPKMDNLSASPLRMVSSPIRSVMNPKKGIASLIALIEISPLRSLPDVSSAASNAPPLISMWRAASSILPAWPAALVSIKTPSTEILS